MMTNAPSTTAKTTPIGAQPVGTAVTGTYCGVAIRGTLKWAPRAHTMNHLAWFFFVELAEPIMLFGREESGVLLVMAAFDGSRLPADVWPSSEAISAA